jgi:hypothetical protein
MEGVGFAIARDEAIASRWSFRTRESAQNLGQKYSEEANTELYKIYRETVNQKQTDNGEQMREGSCELIISKLPTAARNTSTVEADERRPWFLQKPLQ